MFRRVESGLIEDHPDPHWNADLKKLGYFITDSGLLRMIDRPDQRFNFFITNHERYNEVHREAMQKCVRREVEARMSQLGIQKLYLPQLTYEKPAKTPHNPIFAPPAEVLKAKKRIVVFINDDFQDLGVLAYRWLYGEGGFDGGSCVELAKDLTKRSPAPSDGAPSTPGLVVLNPGSLWYSHKFNSAMTQTSWLAMPRKSIAHPHTVFDGIENTIPGHRTVEEHIQTVFDKVIYGDLVASTAEVYVVAVSRGAGALLGILDENWAKYGHKLSGLALIDPPPILSIQDSRLGSFLKHRARTWAKSTEPVNTFVATPFIPIPTGLEVYGLSKDEQDVVDQSGNTTPTAGVVDWLETVSHAGVTRQQIHDFIGFNDSKTYLDHVQECGLEDALVSAGPSMVNLPAADKGPKFARTAGHQGDEDSADEARNVISKVLANQPGASETLYPTFSGGEDHVAEMIFVHVKDAILDWFEDIARNPTDYKNPTFTLAPKELADRTDEEVAAEMAALELEKQEKKDEGVKEGERKDSAM